MSRHTALVFNVLALATLAWLIADNGLPSEEDFALLLILAAAPAVSLLALWRRPRERAEPAAREVLDFDDRLAVLEAAERRRARLEASRLATNASPVDDGARAF